ncbi:hypothetical protein VTK56DRAFT_3504 [Thermocarpiscus australiensis]
MLRSIKASVFTTTGLRERMKRTRALIVPAVTRLLFSRGLGWDGCLQWTGQGIAGNQGSELRSSTRLNYTCNNTTLESKRWFVGSLVLRYATAVKCGHSLQKDRSRRNTLWIAGFFLS